MTTFSIPKKIDDVQQLTPLFRELITELLNEKSSILKIKRVSVEIPQTDILNWYTRQQTDLKLFWSDRDNTFTVAGIHSADTIKNGTDPKHEDLFHNIQQKILAAENEIKYYGGFKFDINSGSTKEWESFGVSKFTLPRFEMTQQDDKFQFVCNLLLPNDCTQKENILNELDQLDFSSTPVSLYDNSIVKRSDCPDKGRWMEMVNQAVRSCTTNQFDKIVLARKTSLTFLNKIIPDLIFTQLYQNSANCFHFSFQENKSKAFVGATPERLYLRSGTTVKCEAVAGTRRRDSNEKIDRLLGEELIDSKKDIKEHSYVVDSILESLMPYLDQNEQISDSKTNLLKLTRVQHLIRKFRFKVKENVSDFELINSLHPTAAVGGYPKNNVTNEIYSLEQFDRGWYAAPIGWIGKDASEFAVAIRSGLIDDYNLNLYSGAGIIDGSVSESEWDEIENKISNFLKVLS